MSVKRTLFKYQKRILGVRTTQKLQAEIAENINFDVYEFHFLYRKIVGTLLL